MDIKRILRSYDFESMPLFRSHEEYFAALEDLENMWKKLESCRIETKLNTIHDKIYHTTSSTPDDNRKTVISSILERFPSLLEENSKIEENFEKLSTEPSANNALRKRSQSRVVGRCVIHSGTITARTEKFLSIKAYELEVVIQYFPFITCYFEMLCFIKIRCVCLLPKF